MPESRDSNCFKYKEKYTLKLSRSGKILDADREFVEKIGYDLDSILSATIFDLVERSDVIEKLEEGGEVEVIGVDGNSYTMHLYNAGDFIYAYDIRHILPNTERNVCRSLGLLLRPYIC